VTARRAVPDERKPAPPASAAVFTPPGKCEFLGIRVDALTVPSMFDATAAAIAGRQRVVIANHNLHSIYLQRRSAGMRRFFARADYVHADGMWVVHLARLFGQPLSRANRITSLDFLGPLLELAQREGWRVFFLGGTASVTERFERYIRATYPALSSRHHDGYFDMRPGAAENEKVLTEIQSYAPHILFVCMGMPRQERWIHANRDQLAANVTFPLGGIMDYLVGETATPPRWTGPLGVEWAYRLLHDPRRLAGRYIWEPICLAPWIAREAVLAQRRRGRRSRPRSPVASPTGGHHPD
jgi:N-acetylglucosaminyldiphosphoundecaprenol N-acetyl-beta-D-mannosaminyltransferase